VIDERRSPGSGAMTVDQIEHEFARLRMNEDGTVGLRSSVLNLVVVTDEESAEGVTRVVSKLSGRFPSRAIVLISDPEEEEANLDIELSAFCDVRSGMGSQVCAEQVKIHAEGLPARHLESLAGPLLLPDLPVFLWYPGPFSTGSPELSAMISLADRLIVDSGASPEKAACLKSLAGLLDSDDVPALGDLQWVGISPWRALIAELFNPPERGERLREIERVEILRAHDGEARALLLVGWLASALGWRPESLRGDGEVREMIFSGPAGEITVAFTSGSPETSLRRVRLYAGELSFQVSRHREQTEARTTVMRGEELLGERTVYLGAADPVTMLGEELQYRGRDEVYESALRMVAEMLSL
jgi:glucose-6-phosphate dehydrogenase assembly protein OpcA